jgi:ATP-binding cassette, subfamily B, bacterial
MSEHEQLKPNGRLEEANQTQIRYLTPDMCTIYVGTHKALHLTIKDEWTYGGIHAAYAFPVAHHNQFISLLQSVGDGKELEIGIIRDLDEFPAEQAELIRLALARRYFIHRIKQIHEIGWRYNLIFLDVETDKGRCNFFMQWKSHRAVDYGKHGKVLIDVCKNRYLIPDLDELSAKERDEFTRIIYW